MVAAVTVSFTFRWRDGEIVGADGGGKALDPIEAEHPDLVLLDVAMPGIDGFETPRRIRAFSAVPVILLTARAGVLDTVMG